MTKRMIILLFAALYLSATCVFSHPGRLDANGGHYNRKTGEYHYHDGTNHSGGSSSSSSSENYYYYQYEQQRKQQEELERQEALKKQQEEEEQKQALLRQQAEEEKLKDQRETLNVLGILLLITAFVIILNVTNKIKELIYTYNQIKTQSFTFSLEQLKLLDLPPNITIAPNGLPEGLFSTPRGVTSYKVLVSPRGKKYHQRYCKTLHNSRMYSLNVFIAQKQYEPCLKCCKGIEKYYAWFTNAKQIYVIPQYLVSCFDNKKYK